MPPHSPASQPPTRWELLPFLLPETHWDTQTLPLFHFTVSRARFHLLHCPLHLLPKHTALADSAPAQQIAAPQLSLLYPLMSPVNRQPGFILLWKPPLSPSPAQCWAHSRRSVNLCSKRWFDKGKTQRSLSKGAAVFPPAHTWPGFWVGPLLTLSKQLGHHVLTAGLGLLRLARQAAVCRFQSLCFKIKERCLSVK